MMTDACTLHVHDGDTIIACSAEGRRERWRLRGIDAPEMRGSPACRPARAATHWCGEWALAIRARDYLADILRHGYCTRTGVLDPYRRQLVRCTVNGRDVGQMMIEQGYARIWRRRR